MEEAMLWNRGVQRIVRIAGQCEAIEQAHRCVLAEDHTSPHLFGAEGNAMDPGQSISVHVFLPGGKSMSYRCATVEEHTDRFRLTHVGPPERLLACVDIFFGESTTVIVEYDRAP